MYPINRNRRLRVNETLRSLIRETIITPNDFLVPLFVIEGQNKKEEIQSMPNYFKMSIDVLLKEVETLYSLGLKSVLLFAQVDEKLKDNYGSEAINKDGLMQRAIKSIKDKYPSLLVMSDVALDPYSSNGHDGVVENGLIVNDITNDILSKMSLTHIEAGADFVAPSDMMDGRVKAIRDSLESNNFVDTIILSYAAKYASSFYGPFRDAVGSAANLGNRSKKTYQMNFSNIDEALHEVEMDINEGADIVMIKPGTAYLDVVHAIKSKFQLPTFVYQVSGEYSMLALSIEKGWLDKNVMLESLVCCKRAGADAILTYAAKQIASELNT